MKRSQLFSSRPLWWEEGGVSDPTVINFSGKTHMLYQAVGSDGLSRLGLAVASDGEHFERLDLPILEGDERSTLERLGLVTPRITQLGRDFYIAYAALSVHRAESVKAPDLAVPWRSRISLLKTRDLRRFERLGAVMADLDSHDPVLFPVPFQRNYWLLHRLDKGMHVSISSNLRSWGGGYQLLEPEVGWEDGGIAAACAPVEVARGWLLFYNAQDAKGVSRIGAVLLDRHNPAFVIGRTTAPLFEAQEDWEKRGSRYRGVRLGGAVVAGDELLMYYGAGGTIIGLGTLSVDAVFQSLGLSAAP